MVIDTITDKHIASNEPGGGTYLRTSPQPKKEKKEKLLKLNIYQRSRISRNITMFSLIILRIRNIHFILGRIRRHESRMSLNGICSQSMISNRTYIWKKKNTHQKSAITLSFLRPSDGEKKGGRGKIYSHLYKTAQPASKAPEVPAPYKYKFPPREKYPLQSRQTNSNGD